MKGIIVLASLFASGSVLANDIDPMGFEKEHFLSSMTRADVVAASKTRLIVDMPIDGQGRTVVAPSTLSRAEVEAETREAARLGLIRYGEVDPVFVDQAREEKIKLAVGHTTENPRVP